MSDDYTLTHSLHRGRKISPYKQMGNGPWHPTAAQMLLSLFKRLRTTTKVLVLPLRPLLHEQLLPLMVMLVQNQPAQEKQQKMELHQLMGCLRRVILLQSHHSQKLRREVHRIMRRQFDRC